MIGVPGMTSTRRSVKMEKPRPLKISSLGDQSMESVLSEMDLVSQQLNSNNFDRGVYVAVVSLCENLKMFGHQLESVYKDQLDRCYVALRNGCRDDRLTLASRYRLLEVIELRAMHWQPNENLITYYKQKLAQIEAEEATLEDQQNVEISGYMTTGTLLTPTSGVTTPVFPGQYPTYPTQQVIYATQSTHTPQQIITQNNIPGTPPPLPTLGPGEVIKNSGKYTKPMRIPGKNYCKDEIVIRNADSGKVMGLKGRRVHMIEELSETIISFQRVAPGARERLVQITGPTEENILHAKQLIEETIRRNASPVRCEERDTIYTSLGGSSSSISSHASDEPHQQGLKRNNLSGSSLDDALGEYRYTVVHENDVLRITGNNLDLVRTAKLILDEYFNGEQNLNAISSSTGSDSDQTTTVAVTPPKRLSPPKVTTPPKSISPPQILSRGKSPVAVSESASKSNGFKPAQNVDQQNLEDTSKTTVVTIVRQPLIPMSSKEAIESVEKGNKDVTNENVKNRRMLFAKTSDERSSQQATDDTDGHSTTDSQINSRINYTRELLVKYSTSPSSRLTPENWAQVIRQNPSVVKKSRQYLTAIIAKMNENGDQCMNSATTYLQKNDILQLADLEQAKMRWSLLRTTSAIDDEDNGNLVGGSP